MRQGRLRRVRLLIAADGDEVVIVAQTWAREPATKFRHRLRAADDDQPAAHPAAGPPPGDFGSQRHARQAEAHGSEGEPDADPAA